MEIKIPEEVVTAALEDAARQALDVLLRGHDVHKALTRAVSSSISAQFIAKAVEGAVQSMDASNISQVIAREMQRNIAVAVAKVVEDAAVEMIARMRSCYTDTEKQSIRMEIRQAKEKQ